ncbi:hypothetical protein MRX96_040906 [Rhipicephalus microplus]
MTLGETRSGGGAVFIRRRSRRLRAKRAAEPWAGIGASVALFTPSLIFRPAFLSHHNSSFSRRLPREFTAVRISSVVTSFSGGGWLAFTNARRTHVYMGAGAQ